MKSLMSILAVLALVGAVSVSAAPTAFAAAAPPATTQARPVRGKISKIDGDKVSITVGRGENTTEKVVTVTDKTEITIDKEAKTKADLKVGLFVQVTVDGDKATKIVASTTAPQRRGGGGGGGGRAAGG